MRPILWSFGFCLCCCCCVVFFGLVWLGLVALSFFSFTFVVSKMAVLGVGGECWQGARTPTLYVIVISSPSPLTLALSGCLCVGLSVCLCLSLPFLSPVPLQLPLSGSCRVLLNESSPTEPYQQAPSHSPPSHENHRGKSTP